MGFSQEQIKCKLRPFSACGPTALWHHTHLLQKEILVLCVLSLQSSGLWWCTLGRVEMGAGMLHRLGQDLLLSQMPRAMLALCDL